MKAVIMAGGEGTRLRPQTSNLPKPMLPLVGRPMMEHIISLLRRHGITDIVVTVAFLPNAIRSYFGNGSELGVRMVYATEETPLGTAGSVRNARDELTERFLVISGDVLTDINLTAMIEFHEKNNALATLAREALVSVMVVLLAALGAARINVLWIGKAGTFALMFSYPAFLLSDGTAQWQGPIRVIAWICGVLGLALAWAAAAGYVGPARDALRMGRSARRSAV